MTSRRLWARDSLVGLSALLVLTLHPGPTGVAAQPLTCGSVIAQDTVLQEDLDLTSCGEPERPIETVLTIVGPAVFDLNGFELRCRGDELDGAGGRLAIEGKRAIIRDGEVDFCRISAWGTGFHTISRLSTFISEVELYSERNHLLRNTLTGQLAAATVFSDGNQIHNNDLQVQITAGDPSGIFVMGNHNVIRKNIIVYDFGIRIFGGSNWITNNDVSGTSRILISISGQRNFVSRNEFSGFGRIFLGRNTIFVANEAITEDSTIVAVDDRNQIIRNIIDISTNTPAIEVFSGSQQNKIIGNVIVNPLSPLIDENANCDRNIWRANSGGVGDQACIR